MANQCLQWEGLTWASCWIAGESLIVVQQVGHWLPSHLELLTFFSIELPVIIIGLVQGEFMLMVLGELFPSGISVVRSS